MAIINCPGCGEKVSDGSPYCPGCGYPVLESLQAGADARPVRLVGFTPGHRIALLIGAFGFVGGVWFGAPIAWAAAALAFLWGAWGLVRSRFAFARSFQERDEEEDEDIPIE